MFTLKVSETGPALFTCPPSSLRYHDGGLEATNVVLSSNIPVQVYKSCRKTPTACTLQAGQLWRFARVVSGTSKISLFLTMDDPFASDNGRKSPVIQAVFCK